MSTLWNPSKSYLRATRTNSTTGTHASPPSRVSITANFEPHAPFAAAYKKACETAKWQFKLMVHPGGHHFPETWDDERTAAMKFLFE